MAWPDISLASHMAAAPFSSPRAIQLPIPRLSTRVVPTQTLTLTITLTLTLTITLIRSAEDD